MNQKTNRIEYFFKVTLMHNIWYKILSVILAVMTWVVIINLADPVTTKNFNGLEVEVRNQNAITSINQVYEVVEGSTVDFTVKGKASVVKNLKLSDFIAYADLSQLSPVYATDIVVTCNKTDAIEIESYNKMMVVKLEDIDSKNVQVSVETTGDAADGYYVGDFEVKPNMITVSGAASRISKLSSIKIKVNVDGAKKSFSTRLAPVAYDEDGNMIDSKYLTFTNNDQIVDGIDIDVSIFNTKTIPVLLDISGEPAQGFVYNNNYEYTPQTITIGGPGKRLSKIDSITIPVDITDAEEQYETNISMQTYLPDSVKIVGDEEVSVRVLFDEILTKNITLSVNDIELRNVPEGKAAEFTDANATVSLVLKGTKEQIGKFNKDTIGAYIDLKNKDLGVFYVQPECSEVADDLFETRPGTIKVELKRETEGDQTISPVPTQAVTATEKPDDSAADDPGNTDSEGGQEE